MGDLKIPADNNVVVGFEGQDDAAVYRLGSGQLIVQTVDFFTPIVDDPYTFGQIAAANSLSDVYAMGAKPLFALNIVGFPVKTLPKAYLTAILQGGADKASEAGITIVGGHSIDDLEPKYGLVVTGEVRENKLVRNNSAQPGDLLILTKPLGTGIIASAIKQENVDESALKLAIESMSLLNKRASDLMLEFGVHSATDVTGFGLLGHVHEMADASNVSIHIDFSALQFFPTVRRIAEQGIIPGGTKRNLNYFESFIQFSDQLDHIDKIMTADAQTSGGLLLSMSKDTAHHFLDSYNEDSSFQAVIIGTINASEDYPIYLE